jgi:acyl-CoA-binding protein
MALKDDFEAAVQRVQKLPAAPGPADLLELYALYKQSTSGDVQGKRPGMLDVKGRAKYDAWAAKTGLTADRAMELYIQKVGSLFKS